MHVYNLKRVSVSSWLIERRAYLVGIVKWIFLVTIKEQLSIGTNIDHIDTKWLSQVPLRLFYFIFYAPDTTIHAFGII